MVLFGYQLFVRLLALGARLVSFAKPKIKKQVEGQAASMAKLRSAPLLGPVAWFHCASLGEFEQARPLIEALKAAYPHYGIAVTFFSPSGYEARKGYAGADFIGYMPFDTPSCAKEFIGLLQPSIVFWVKYDFWLNHLAELKKREVPTYLLSANFRQEQLRWPMGAVLEAALPNFEAVFLQYESSEPILDRLLERVPNGQQPKVYVTGDTRFDNVLAKAQGKPSLPKIEILKGTGKLLVLGSIWPDDVACLARWLKEYWDGETKIVVVPHDPDPKWVGVFQDLAPAATVSTYTMATDAQLAESQILVVDVVGVLFNLYSFATVAWVGGGFGTGLHNILEPAAWGVPVIFGPKTAKFPEAEQMVQAKGGIQVHNPLMAAAALYTFLKDDRTRNQYGSNARTFIEARKGATDRILPLIAQNMA